MDKLAQLGALLARLPVAEAVRLARAVELGRVMGKEELPTDLVLAALRPSLREARPPRVPTLRRVVCTGFEYFLIDIEDDPRIAGRIARAVIAPWWTALKRIAGAEISGFEERLAASYAEDGAGVGDALARQAKQAATGWTKALVAELGKPRIDDALRKLFPRAGLVADVKTIATVLALAEPLGAAFAAIEETVATSGHLDGRQITELVPEAVTAAKQHYLALIEAHGVDGGLLALALLNRLCHPWHILRLGRALSWKQDDSLLRQTEFSVVGERLILDLSRGAREIVEFAGRRAGLDIARLSAGVAGYMDEAEGLLGEIGFRRDSAWGETILQTRVAVSDAIGREFLARLGDGLVATLMPVARRSGSPRGVSPDPDLSAPPSETVLAEATAAARFLLMLLHRGARHGFGQPARDAIDTVGNDIDERVNGLLEALRQTPDHPVIDAQIAAAVQVLDILFEDGRGATIVRRTKLARQATA